LFDGTACVDPNEAFMRLEEPDEEKSVDLDQEGILAASGLPVDFHNKIGEGFRKDQVDAVFRHQLFQLAQGVHDTLQFTGISGKGLVEDAGGAT